MPQGALNQSSLAIVYLPSAHHDLAEHAFYIPVLIPPPPSLAVNDAGIRRLARDDWDSLLVPASRTLRLKEGPSSVLFDSKDLCRVEPGRIHNVMQALLVQNAKKEPVKSVMEHLTSVHAVTL